MKLISTLSPDFPELYKQLSSNKNIKNIIRQDIAGDKLSNTQSFVNFFDGGLSTILDGDAAPHFDLARPGVEADKKIQNAVINIKNNGVKN